MHPSIFREYDIRGEVGKTLFESDAEAIGDAFGKTVIEKTGNATATVCVGFDGRVSSPALKENLIRGLQSAGCSVISIGVGPTPMLYFAACTQNAEAGVMVTGSHNPPSHNGFKFMLQRKPFFGESIAELGKKVVSWQGSKSITSHTSQALKHIDIVPAYLEKLLSVYTAKKPIHVVWDAGNGATGNIMKALCENLPGKHIPLFAEIDGTFPNHHPDPSVPENMEMLVERVKSEKADLGIAFDGDGDRVGVVDGEGNVLPADRLMMILAREVLTRHPGATIIADVKSSQHLFDDIATHGGKPLMWKTGHSHIKAKMQEMKAPLAGELSGHIFYADGYFGYDDGLYAAMRLLNILAGEKQTPTQLFASLPSGIISPEYRIDCADDRKFVAIAEIKARLEKEGIPLNLIDGVRVQTKDGWWLLRASNTQAALTARAEADSEAGLARLMAHMKEQLKLSGVTL